MTGPRAAQRWFDASAVCVGVVAFMAWVLGWAPDGWVLAIALFGAGWLCCLIADFAHFVAQEIVDERKRREKAAA